MSKQIIDYQAEIYCQIADEKINLIFGHHDYDNGHDSSFVKILCPFYTESYWGFSGCEKGGKCGIAKGARSS